MFLQLLVVMDQVSDIHFFQNDNSHVFCSVKVWDNRWFILYAYVGHQDRVLTLNKHPFGPYIISSSQDRTIRVWSLEYGDVVDV